MEPDELKSLIADIRSVEKLLGSPLKKPVESEISKLGVNRKSIVAATRITAGDCIDRKSLAFKRATPGLSPLEADRVIGKIAKVDIGEDEVISPDKLY